MALQLRELATANHQRFVKRVVASREVWGLRGANGWVVCDSTESSEEHVVDVMPFWSDRAYAARAAIGDWSQYEPTSIPLNVFIDQWLKGMARDSTRVGTNWDANNCGLEVDPADLARELLIELGERVAPQE